MGQLYKTNTRKYVIKEEMDLGEKHFYPGEEIDAQQIHGTDDEWHITDSRGQYACKRNTSELKQLELEGKISYDAVLITK